MTVFRCMSISVALLASAAVNARSLQSERQMAAKLEERTSMTVSGASLRQQLQQMSAESGLSFVRDRRIDPHLTLNAETGFVPRLQAIRRLFPEESGIRVGFTDHVIYIGPADSVLRLPAVVDKCRVEVTSAAASLPGDERRTIASNAQASIPFLAEPRQIVMEAVAGTGIRIRNPDAVPHDVWEELTLPPMPVADRLALILIQFDLCAESSEQPGELVLVPIDEAAPFERRYSVRRQEHSACEREILECVEPGALRWSGSTAIVTATIVVHSDIDVRLERMRSAGSQASPPEWIPLQQRSFTLTVKRTTLGNLIASLRQQKIPVEVVDEDDPEVRELLQRTVEIDVRSEPAERFFSGVFGDAFRTVEVLKDKVILKR